MLQMEAWLYVQNELSICRFAFFERSNWRAIEYFVCRNSCINFSQIYFFSNIDIYKDRISPQCEKLSDTIEANSTVVPTTSQTASQERKDWQIENMDMSGNLIVMIFRAYLDVNLIIVMSVGDRDTELNGGKRCIVGNCYRKKTSWHMCWMWYFNTNVIVINKTCVPHAESLTKACNCLKEVNSTELTNKQLSLLIIVWIRLLCELSHLSSQLCSFTTSGLVLLFCQGYTTEQPFVRAIGSRKTASFMYIVCLPGIVKWGRTLNAIEWRKKEVSQM